MDALSLWRQLFSRSRKQISFDIEHCSPLTVRKMLLDIRTPASILDGIARVYCDDEDILCDLVRCPNLSETTLAFIALAGPEEIKEFISRTRVLDVVMADDVPDTPEPALPGQQKPRTLPGNKKLNVLQQIQRMTTPQKLKLAMTGAKDARGLLVRESNKQISMSVLENARITDGEIEFFSKATNLHEDILRKIGTHPEWAKKYAIVQSLVNNPKTPPGVALPFVNRMTDRDLGLLEKNRNVGEAVRTAARGLLLKRKKKQLR